jgi:hypothetical protein
MGIVFNGAKIGFSRFELSPSAESDRFEIRSEAYFRIRFLMMDKRIRLKSIDRVKADLTLDRFTCDYDLDGNQMSLSGRLNGDVLEVKTVNRQAETIQSLALENRRIYPSSAIDLYPVLHGLDVGQHYRYWIYDGQTRRLAEVVQHVAAYEESDLYRGAAYRIETRLHNQSVTTWMDVRGVPLLEMSLGGVIIAHHEDPATAHSYLAHAALNKDEALLHYSLIPSERPGEHPDRLRRLRVQISGMPADWILPNDPRQSCVRQAEDVVCRIGIDQASREPTRPPGDSDLRPSYLLPSFSVSAHHPEIRRLAEEITAGAPNDLESSRALVDWMQTHIQRKAVDGFTALDVLQNGAAECQGHALLYAAFERSRGMPCRVVNGLVYSESHAGFLYHSWNETYLQGQWIAVDPTFGQVPADATHVKLLEGEETADLLPLMELIGKLRIHILDFE